ncbi:MAG: hypothetical protein P8Z42_03365, partial [Anaerolineales bacterium]
AAHAKAAQVPIIVALNKIDKANAEPDRVKQQLAEIGLIPDEWDGDTIVVPISAKEKTGLEPATAALQSIAPPSFRLFSGRTLRSPTPR